MWYSLTLPVPFWGSSCPCIILPAIFLLSSLTPSLNHRNLNNWSHWVYMWLLFLKDLSHSSWSFIQILYIYISLCIYRILLLPSSQVPSAPPPLIFPPSSDISLLLPYLCPWYWHYKQTQTLHHLFISSSLPVVLQLPKSFHTHKDLQSVDVTTIYQTSLHFVIIIS